MIQAIRSAGVYISSLLQFCISKLDCHMFKMPRLLTLVMFAFVHVYMCVELMSNKLAYTARDVVLKLLVEWINTASTIFLFYGAGLVL